MKTTIRRTATALFAAALHAGGLAAQVDRTKSPALGAPPALHLPDIRTATLPNGLTLAVVEMHKVPVVEIQALVDAGTARDPVDLPGLAAFTANMLTQGAGTRGTLALADEVAYLGAQLNAASDFDVVTVRLHVPKRHLEPALDLLADVLLRPQFADSEVTRQRGLLANTILQQRDQPVAMAGIAFPAVVLGAGHPYGHPAAGNDSTPPKLTRDRVVAFYQAAYRPNATRILIVGDITLDEAKRLFTARFGAWPRGAVAAFPQAAAPAPAARAFYLVDKPGAAQSVIRIGEPGVARSTPDYATLQVLNTILGGAFTSRLNQNLRETHGYTYGASSAFAARRLPAFFVAAASVVTAKTDSSLIEFMKELRRIRDEAVPQAELDKAKSYIALQLPGAFETSGGAAARFRDLLVYGLPLDWYDRFIPAVGAVTAADVQRAARRYIDPDHLAIVVVGDRAQIETGIKALNEGPIVYRTMWGAPVP
jgi:predicted Zn-dependent peptidase